MDHVDLDLIVLFNFKIAKRIPEQNQENRFRLKIKSEAGSEI
jgi:hypothetical protein